MSRKSFLSLLAALVVLVLSVAPIGVHAQQCATMRTRKGLSQLSPTEWNSYVNGLHKMKANGALDRLTKRHREGMKYHGTPYFLLMHRALVLDFENELLAVSPGLQGTPYWDELREASGPKKSDVFTVPRLSPIAPGPLQGQFAGLRDDSGNLVTRNPPGVSPGVTWLPANQVLAQAMKGFTSFGQMSSIIEVSPHNQFHVLIGGHMGNPAISPSDPAFWTHHAYIDLLWALWQSLAPQNAMDLRTPNNNPLLKSADPVVLYPTKYTNRDMLLYRQRLCYQYTYPTQTPTKLKKRSAPAAAAAAEGGDTPSVNGCTSQYFTPLGAIPDSLVYQIMPNMSMTQWRAAEAHMNCTVNDLNMAIASGKVTPASLPTVGDLFVKAGLNCTTEPLPYDDGCESLLLKSGASSSLPMLVRRQDETEVHFDNSSNSSSSGNTVSAAPSQVALVLVALVSLFYI